MEEIIFLLILPFLAFELDASADAITSRLKQTEDDGKKWHRFQAALLTVLFVPLAYFATSSLWGALIWALYVVSVRITYFNIRLNVKRNKKTFELGTTSWIDALIMKYKLKVVYFVCGFLSIIGCGILFWFYG